MNSRFHSRMMITFGVLWAVISLATPILTLAASPQKTPAIESQPVLPSTLAFVPEPLPELTASHPKMDTVLVSLAQAAQESGQAAGNLAESRNLRFHHGQVQVQITVSAGQSNSAEAAVHSLGGEISGRSHDGKLLQAWLPAQTLLSLAEHSSVAYIRPPAQAILTAAPQASDVSSEALSLINVPIWHSAGLYGNGVKLAIVDAGFDGYESLLGSELPPVVTARNFVDGENELDVNGTTDNGVAVAEIVYDIAPQASLYLVKINTPIDLQEAVDWLILQDVDIINTSVGWFNVSPGDGSGFFADLAQLARNNGIFWVTAAGNYRQLHWGGAFFTMNPSAEYPTHYYNTSQNVNNFIYKINSNTPIYAYLRWDDWNTVDQDYRLVLVRYREFPYFDWVIEASSNNPQTGLAGQTPTESIAINAPETAYYGFVIFRISSTRDVNLELFASNYYSDPLDEFLTSRSLLNLADVPSVFTTSAVDVVAPYLQEFYSSEGPTNGPGGTADGGLLKPDIAGYANVSTLTYGAGTINGGSATTPHVSGAATLVKSAAPAYTPDQTQWYLQTQAIDLGAPGKDTLFGYGRLTLGDPLVFQTPPDIATLPDQLLAVNTSLSQAIDLWAYTSDTYTPDEQLLFSIDNTPLPEAGISITDNRYLSITPQADWTGQTLVSVRVTTPYAQFDTDQLLVSVLAPPEISELPNQILPTNTGLNPPIDLWAYSTDAFYTVEELNFSIDNTPNPDAGVSLSDNRYIQINPSADWSGQTQVQVRVASPIGLSDTTTFTVFVLAPPEIHDLPDQYLPVNTSLNQAIDLWAYTSDPYIPVDQMVFTIDNIPDPEAGVTLSNNRYIDIQPALDWMGQTSVIVRVTSPYGLYQTDEFNVFVGGYKIWNGSLSQAWEEGLNWTPVGVPQIEDGVVIPYTANQPLLSSPAAVDDLIIQRGAKLDLGQSLLSVEGSVSNLGTLQQTQLVNPGEISQFLHLTNQTGDQNRYYGVDILPAVEELPEGTSQAADLPVTVSVAGEQLCNLRFSGVLRCYDIQVSQLLTATLTFYFSPGEANGLAPESLVTYRLDEYWREETAAFVSGNNDLAQYLTVPEQTAFGVFSLDQSGSPTHACMLPLVHNNFNPPDITAGSVNDSILEIDRRDPAGIVQLVQKAWQSILEIFLS